MSASCVEKECIAPLAVRHYNFLKWIVLGLLAALLLGMLGRSCAAAALAAPTLSAPSGTIDPQAVTLTGTGAPNSRVVVDVDGEEFVVDVDGNGDWSLTTDTLSDGDYSARVAAISPEGGELAFGNTSDWSVATAVVDGDDDVDDDGDIVAPVAALAALGGLALADFAADGELTAGNFSWNGTGEPGATVELLANGDVLDRATVDADGNWAFNGGYNFAAGDDVDFSARMVGADGGDLGNIDGATVSIPDLTMAEAVAPTLTLDGDSDVREGDEITFSGTAEPNAEVEILVDGEVVDTVSADADGNFTYSTSDLPAGEYMLSARTVDGELETDAVAFNVSETPAIKTPALARIFGGNSADTPIEFSGTAEPNSEVELFVDGESIGTTTADADGNFTLSAPVAVGDRVVVARYTDDDTIASDEQPFTVADFNGIGPAIGSATTNDDGTVSVSGTAPAGSSVDITSGGEVIGTATADDDGNFSADVTLPDDNDNTVGAQTTGDNGVTVGFDSTPVEAGAMVDAGDGDSDDDDGATGTDDTDDDTADSSNDDDDTADSSDGDDADAGGSDTVVVTNVEALNDENGNTPTIGTVDFGMSGTGRPGELIIVLENGEQVGGATVQADGTWSCTCILPPGEHTLIIQEANNPDNVSEPVTFVVENRTEAPPPPRVTPGSSASPVVCKGDPPFGTIQGHIYIVAQCESLSLIAQRLGTTLAKMLEYNPQVAAPNQIYPGQSLNIPSDAGCFDTAGG